MKKLIKLISTLRTTREILSQFLLICVQAALKWEWGYNRATSLARICRRLVRIAVSIVNFPSCVGQSQWTWILHP